MTPDSIASFRSSPRRLARSPPPPCATPAGFPGPCVSLWPPRRARASRRQVPSVLTFALLTSPREPGGPPPRSRRHYPRLGDRNWGRWHRCPLMRRSGSSSICAWWHAHAGRRQTSEGGNRLAIGRAATAPVAVGAGHCTDIPEVLAHSAASGDARRQEGHRRMTQGRRGQRCLPTARRCAASAGSCHGAGRRLAPSSAPGWSPPPA